LLLQTSQVFKNLWGLRWFRKIRTLISSFVVKYSYPLNYKPILLYDFQIWTEYTLLMFTSQKERKMSMLPLHQAVLFSAFAFLISPFKTLYSFFNTLPSFIIQNSLFLVPYFSGWLRVSNPVLCIHSAVLYQIS
jgi:hypothetical protein